MEYREQIQSDQSNTLQWVKRAVYKIWRFHHVLIISLLTLFAVLLLAIRGMALYLESNPTLIKTFIEQQLEQSVSFDKVFININLLYPSVSLENFSIHYTDENKSRLNFHSASISINVLQSIFKSQAIIDTLTLDGFYALIRRNKKGEFLFSGIPLQSADSNLDDTEVNKPTYLNILNQSNFIITHSEIYFVDETGEYPNVFLNEVNFRMHNNNEQHQITIQSAMNNKAIKAELRLDFKGRINNIKQWNGQVYTKIEGLDYPTLLHLFDEKTIQMENYVLDDIDLGLHSWADIKQGKLHSVRGKLYLNDAQIKRLDTKEQVYFNRVDSNFKLQRHKEISQDWVLDLFDVNFNIDGKIISDKRIQLHFKNLYSRPSLQVYLNQLKIGEFSHVVNFFSPENISKRIYQHIKPRGEFNNIQALVHFKSLDMPIDITDYQVSAGIKNFGLNSFHTLPKIRNLSARMVLNKDRGRVYLKSHDMRIHVKSLFRDTWPVDTLSGEVYWQKIQDNWLLGVKEIDLVNPHLKAQAELKLWFQNSGAVLMDLSGFYRDANVKYTSYYLPAYIMNQGLVKWLDTAIVSGQGTDGGVVFRGELSQFPYKNQAGIMDIVFHTKNVDLNYTPGWPQLKEVSSQIQFTEQGMWIVSDHSRIFSSISKNIHASIDDYHKSILRLHGDINSSIKDGVHYLKQSKLASENVTDMLDARGSININLDLVIPTMAGQPNSNVTIKLNKVDYYPPGLDKKPGLVSQLSGKVKVHNQNINAENLSAKIMGRPANIVIKSLSGGSRKNSSPDVNIAIDTPVSVEQVKKFKLIPEAILPVSEYISGQTRVNIDLNLPNENRPFAVSVASGLVGLKSTLPYPLAKAKNKSQSLKVSYEDSQYPEFTFSLADILSLALIVNVQDESAEIIKGNLVFGRGQVYLPEKKVLKLSGKIPLLPYSQWQNVITSLAGETKYKPSEKSMLPVELALKELILPKPKLEKDSNTVAEKKAEKSYLGPRNFPLINGYISSVKLGNNSLQEANGSLGMFNIKTSRLEKSIIFDSIAFKGDILSFTGKGKWHQWNNTPEVDFEGNLEISSFEEFLKMAGYDQLMRGGKANVSGYLGWPGDLSSYNKQTLEGKLSIEVEKGAYLEGKPGAAGRVLGLLNMNALARRITLDFSDVSDKGFEFNEIKGDFRITRGNAYTDNLRVMAPSAKILVTGRVGLVAEDYDEKVVVVPEISATLPIAGAAVAGPAGAAVAWVGQKLLGSQLNKVTARSYTVKGNWYDPVIEKDELPGNALENIKSLFGIDSKSEQIPEQKNEPVKH